MDLVARIHPNARTQEYKHAAIPHITFFKAKNPDSEDEGWYSITTSEAKILSSVKQGEGRNAPDLFEIKTKQQAQEDVARMLRARAQGTAGRPIAGEGQVVFDERAADPKVMELEAELAQTKGLLHQILAELRGGGASQLRGAQAPQLGSGGPEGTAGAHVSGDRSIGVGDNLLIAARAGALGRGSHGQDAFGVPIGPEIVDPAGNPVSVQRLAEEESKEPAGAPGGPGAVQQGPAPQRVGARKQQGNQMPASNANHPAGGKVAPEDAGKPPAPAEGDALKPADERPKP